MVTMCVCERESMMGYQELCYSFELIRHSIEYRRNQANIKKSSSQLKHQQIKQIFLKSYLLLLPF